jgi:hypothetical protein
MQNPVLVGPRVISPAPIQSFDNLLQNLPLWLAAAKNFGAELTIVVADREANHEREIRLREILRGASMPSVPSVARETLDVWFLDYGALNAALGMSLSGSPPFSLPPTGEGSARELLKQHLRQEGPAKLRDAALKVSDHINLAQLRSRCECFREFESELERVLAA